MFHIFWQDQVLLAVGFGDGTHRAGRIAVGQIAGWNIFCHHAPGADDHIVAYGHAAYYRSVAGDPYIVAYADLLGKFSHGCPALFIKTHPLLSDERVVGGHKGHIGTEADIVSYVDGAVVHDRQVKIGKKVFADESVAAVVELYRSLKIIYLSGFAEDLAYDPAASMALNFWQAM